MSKEVDRAIAYVKARAREMLRSESYKGRSIRIRTGERTYVRGTLEDVSFHDVRIRSKSVVAQFSITVKGPTGIVFGPFVVESLPDV